MTDQFSGGIPGLPHLALEGFETLSMVFQSRERERREGWGRGRLYKKRFR
jgi:hypothetical protein